MKIYFVTQNERKVSEVKELFKGLEAEMTDVPEICQVDISVNEILSSNIDIIVKSKVLEAYKIFGLPCVVEHSGLNIEALKGLPGGIGKIIWDAVGDRMCGFLNEQDSRSAIAVSIIAYCDGKKIRQYRGETRGQIAERKRGDYQFNWDPIFIPEGSNETYGEMGQMKKFETSPAIKSWSKFLREEFPHYFNSSKLHSKC